MRHRRQSFVLSMTSVAIALLIGARDGLASKAIPSGGQQVRPQPNAPPETGLILGRVIDADSTQPVSGVVVSLEGGAPILSPTGVPLGSPRVLTNSDGRFVFLNLSKGTYTVSTTVGSHGFSPSGFLVSGLGTLIGPYLDGGYGQQRPEGPLEPLELANGERVGDIGIKLWKGGAVNGTIVDEAGDPLVGAAVAAVRRTSDGRLLTGPTTQTDDRGVYHIGTLVPGDYVIVVPETLITLPTETMAVLRAAPAGGRSPAATSLSSTGAVPVVQPGITLGTSTTAVPGVGVNNHTPPIRRGDRTLVYQTTFLGGGTSAARAQVVSLKSGEDQSGLDVALHPVAAVSVSGAVIDESGPVANFGIHLLPPDADDGSGVIEVATTASDAKGMFVFPLVPTGSYRLVAIRIPPPVPGSALASQVPSQWATLPVTVVDHDVTGLTVALQPGPTVSGHIVFDGSATMPAPDRLSHLILTLERTPRVSRESDSLIRLSVDTSAAIARTSAPPGRYMIRTPIVPPPWTVESVMAGAHDLTDQPLVVNSTDIGDLVVTYTDQPSGLSGLARTAQGTTDAGAMVLTFPTDRARWPDARMATRSFRSVHVTKAGSFDIPALPAGEYDVIAVSDGVAADWPDAKLLGRLAATATVVRVTGRQHVTVSLTTKEIR